MSPEEFEKQLKQRPMRAVPANWRAEILAAAAGREAGEPATKDASLPAIVSYLLSMLNLRPRALAALAAVWVLILVLHISTRDESPAAAGRTPAAREIIAEVREQKLFYAELLGTREAREAEQPKNLFPRPRSERRIPGATV